MAVIESEGFKSRNTYAAGTDTITSRLDSYVLKVLPQDILVAIRGVAMQELEEQIAAGNMPSQVLVDGRSVSKRGIAEATRSVSMRFADVSALLDAVKEIYALLVRVTRLQSPARNAIVARKHFWLYVNGAPTGRLPGAFASLNLDTLNYKSVLRVVGPLVPYGRKLYWNPIGRSKVMAIRQTTSLAGRSVLHYDDQTSPRFRPYRMRTIRKLANAKGAGNPAEALKKMLKGNPGSVEGAGQIVKRVMRRDRRFRMLYFSDGWVNYPPAGSWGKNSRDSRVPSVSVQMARKGGIKTISI